MTNDKRTTVVLADDQAMIREGFKLLISNQPDLEIVGEAETGTEAVQLVAELSPDVVLMDVQMPDLDGIDATALISASGDTSTRVLILTTFRRDDYVFDALRAGASGFLLKTAPQDGPTRRSDRRYSNRGGWQLAT